MSVFRHYRMSKPQDKDISIITTFLKKIYIYIIVSTERDKRKTASTGRGLQRANRETEKTLRMQYKQSDAELQRNKQNRPE